MTSGANKSIFVIPGCIFRSIYQFEIIKIIENLLDAFWARLHKFELLKKSTCKISRVHPRWIWCSNSSLGGVKPYSGYKLSIFMDFEKNKLKKFVHFRLDHQGNTLRVQYHKIWIFAYWNPHRVSFKLPTRFQIKWDQNPKSGWAKNEKVLKGYVWCRDPFH